MSKYPSVGVIGFLSLCLSLSAQQQTDRSDIFPSLNSSPRFPSLTLSNGGFFSFSTALTWMQPTPTDFLPGLPAIPPERAIAASYAGSRDSSKEVVDMRRNLLDYTSGEVGFLYGRSTGKFGGEYKQAYIIGEIGDEKFHISAGAAYEESSWRVPRFGR